MNVLIEKINKQTAADHWTAKIMLSGSVLLECKVVKLERDSMKAAQEKYLLLDKAGLYGQRARNTGRKPE